jgi:hypothetical protein
MKKRHLICIRISTILFLSLCFLACQQIYAKPFAGDKIPFQQMDTNKDRKLSPYEFRGPSAAFRQLDQNRDGYVSLDEMRQAQNSSSSRAHVRDREKNDTASVKTKSASAATVDTHNHFIGRQLQHFKFSLQEALVQMDKAGVKKVFILPPPISLKDPWTYDYKKLLSAISPYRKRFGFLAGGGSLNVMIQKAVITGQVSSQLRESFKKKAEEIATAGAAGFGEMTAEHLCLGPRHNYQTAPPDHELFLLLADIAAQHKMVIDIHMEAVSTKMNVPPRLGRFKANPRTLTPNIDAFERLLLHNRKANIIWVHCGWDNTGQRSVILDRRLLSKHPNLYMSFKISYRDSTSSYQPIDYEGKLKPEWLELIKEFPDRFMVGSDQFFEPADRKNRFPTSFFETNSILALLPIDLARKVGHENALRLFKNK